MRFFVSFSTFLSLALIASAATVPSAKNFPSLCAAADRIPVSTRTVTAGGFEFQISTEACSKGLSPVEPLAPRSIEKRQFNSCGAGGTMISVNVAIRA